MLWEDELQPQHLPAMRAVKRGIDSSEKTAVRLYKKYTIQLSKKHRLPQFARQDLQRVRSPQQLILDELDISIELVISVSLINKAVPFVLC